MKVLYVLPGSGGSFYCQNCLRDMALADALRARRHTVTLLPLYLPATASMPQPAGTPVFYGALSLYLRHRYAGLRRLPRAWFSPLDRWPVLRLAARFAGTTAAKGLEDLTLSMLRGMDGRQADELGQVTQWLSSLQPESAPDVIVLSNALLMGMAAALKQAARCPVVCWLQDEQVWIDAMSPDLQATLLRVMAEATRAVDRFISVSASYATSMTRALSLDPARITVVFPGIDAAAYTPADVTRRPAVIGFLSRLSPAEGFDRFVDAFLLLRRDPRFADVRLAATGGLSAEKGFLKRQRRKLEAAGAARDATITPERFAHDRRGFLSELTLLSVPGSDKPEAFGYYALEALAAGVPVVAPAQGAFPEIAAAAGCGTLTDGSHPGTLARTWAALLSDPARLLREADAGREAARTVFSLEASAAALEQALAEARARS